MVWLTVLGVLVALVYYFVLRQRAKRQPSIREDQTLNIQPVTLEAARALVDEAVAVGDKFIREPDQQADGNLDSLGPITREFFSKYPGLRSKLGGFRLGVSEVRASEYVAGYTSIGHSEDWDIVVKPKSDEVFVVEGAETAESEMEVRFPTVYHLMLDELRQK